MAQVCRPGRSRNAYSVALLRRLGLLRRPVGGDGGRNAYSVALLRRRRSDHDGAGGGPTSQCLLRGFVTETTATRRPGLALGRRNACSVALLRRHAVDLGPDRESCVAMPAPWLCYGDLDVVQDRVQQDRRNACSVALLRRLHGQGPQALGHPRRNACSVALLRRPGRVRGQPRAHRRRNACSVA